MAHTRVETVKAERNGWTKVLDLHLMGFGQGPRLRKKVCQG